MSAKYIALFALIQLIQVPLFIVGVPLCGFMAYWGALKCGPPGNTWHWAPDWMWLWDNEEDGICPNWYNATHDERSFKVNTFMWTAFRNSVNNYRYVPGVSKPGRPLWYRSWLIRGRLYYAKAGWAPHTGWPMISAGGGRGW